MDELRAIHETAVEGCRVWDAWDGIRVTEADGLVWTESEVDFALFNNVLDSGLPDDRADAVIDEVIARSNKRNRDTAWWIGPGTEPADTEVRLQAKGFVLGGRTTGMFMPLADLAGDAGQFEISATKDLAEWAKIVGQVYELPDFAAEAWRKMYEACGDAFEHYLGRIDGRVVAASTLFVHAGIASISNVCVLTGFRKRGLGRAMSFRPLQNVKKRGIEWAVLCASEMAVQIYSDLGFAPKCPMALYIYTPSGD